MQNPSARYGLRGVRVGEASNPGPRGGSVTEISSIVDALEFDLTAADSDSASMDDEDEVVPPSPRVHGLSTRPCALVTPCKLSPAQSLRQSLHRDQLEVIQVAELPFLPHQRFAMIQPEGLSSCLSRSPSSEVPQQTVTKRDWSA